MNHVESQFFFFILRILKRRLLHFEVQPPKKAKVGRWLCYVFEDISLHIMTREARLKYDLESLWGIGWVEMLEDEVDFLNPELPMPAAS
ncbi:unnamed protein product [Onchocerca flexuosa]|uniref:Ribosomal silencing factor RsfS n=1 Tax=Onchocerca flexuosa TaxID=387005 RepID=A0A183H6P8_9BILA|nr:unnamed protein product [Onchocerca flexuosa]